MNLSFQLCTNADLDVTNEVFTEAYGFIGDRRALLYQFISLQPDGWWLALLDGQPVGFGGAVDYGDFGSIGMLAVHPSVQRRGVGGAMVEHILAWGEMRGCKSMFLEATEQSVSLYARLGFIEEDTTLLFGRDSVAETYQPLPEVETLQASDIPILASFDALYFGANRMKILSSPLDFEAGRAFVTRNNEQHITGYLYAPGFLGPWVASTLNDAEKLLVQALSLPFPRGVSISIPAMNTQGCDLLKYYGFSVKGIDHYMRFGQAVPIQRSVIYGQASPALG